MHEMGYQRGQTVVVPEPDLMGADGVVLVDHRDDAKVEQPVQGAPGVGIVRTPGDVVGSQQDLTDGQVVRPESEAVCRDQGPLADAGCGLLGGQITRATVQPQRRKTGRNGTRGDEDDLSVVAQACRDHVHELAKPDQIQCAAGTSQRAGAYLDDKSPGSAQSSMTRRGHPCSLLKLGQSP